MYHKRTTITFLSKLKIECMKSSFCQTFCLLVAISRALTSFWRYPYLDQSNIIVKVFHWHSDPYMDRLCPSQEYT